MLDFNKHDFKILVLGDVQANGPISKHEQNALKNLVKKANPDFVVFFGDMISGLGFLARSKTEKTIRSIIESTVEDKIPFAVVSGNHEYYALYPFSKQLAIYESYPNCVTPKIANRECQKSYTLDVKTKEKTVFRLLFIDCAGTKLSRFGIDYKKPDQATIDYTNKVLANPNCPPAIIFQHIVVPDVFRLLNISTKESSGVPAHGPYKGKFLTLKNPSAGILGECPCPSWDNTNQFKDWVKSGKVRAVVSAHDHKNSFVDNLDGIDIIQVPCAGFSCYGDDSTRGAYVIKLSKSSEISPFPIYHLPSEVCYN